MVTSIDSGIILPEPNDITICINCGKFGLYDKQLKILPFPPNFFASLSKDKQKELRRIKAVWKQIK